MADTFAVIALGGTAGIYKYSYEDGVITLETSRANSNIDSVFSSRAIVRSADGYYYVMGARTEGITEYIRIYKLDSDLATVTSWGTSGYIKYLSNDDAGMYIDVNIDGTIVAGTWDNNESKPVHYFEADGTERWSGMGYDSDTPANNDLRKLEALAFHPGGDVICLFDTNGSGDDDYICNRLASADGSNVGSYAMKGTGTGCDWGNITYGKSGSFYAGYRSNIYGFIEKWASTNYTSESWIIRAGGFEEWRIDCLLEHNSDGNLFVSYSNTDKDSLHKLSADDGSILSQYVFTNSTGSPTSIAQTDSGYLVYVASSAVAGPDGTFNIWVLDSDMNFLAGYNETTGGSLSRVIGAGVIIKTTSSPTDLSYKKQLVAIAGDSVYYESSAGTMTEITETGGGIGQGAASGLDTTDSLTAAEAYQKVFIANNSVLTVVDFVNERVSCGVAITTSLIPQHGDILTQGTGSVAMVVDAVLSTAKTMTVRLTTGDAVDSGANIIDSSSNVIMATANTISVFSSLPYMYNWKPSLNSSGAFIGSVPDKATLVCMYRGRLVLSGNENYPYQWYMSRQTNPFDFLYTLNDAQTAVAGGNSDAGELGDVITALIQKGDDYLVFGCSNSIWLLRGDPAAGGSLDELTRSTGIYGPRSWCFDDNGYLYFWGRGGIYRMPPDFNGVENLTATVLPNIVSDEAPNKETHRIVLAYDRVRLLIHVFITKMSDGTNSNYVYDVRTQGFFPETYADELAVFSAYFYEAIDPAYQKMYLGSRDSYIRYFDDDKKDDAGFSIDEPINSYAVIGPALISPDADTRGRMNSMSITTGTDTDGVDYEIHVKDTAEEVVDSIEAGSTPLFSGSISSGSRVQTLRPRSRGAWMGIRLSNSTADETWQFEKIVADIVPAGDIK